MRISPQDTCRLRKVWRVVSVQCDDGKSGGRCARRRSSVLPLKRSVCFQQRLTCSPSVKAEFLEKMTAEGVRSAKSMSSSVHDPPVWAPVSPAKDLAPKWTTETFAPSTWPKFTQASYPPSAPVDAWRPLPHGEPEQQLWRRVVDWIVGPYTPPPDTETVGGCGFEILGWKVNFCGHQRAIHAPQTRREYPSLVFPYSDSIYVPEKASGLVPCVDDRGTVTPQATRLARWVRQPPPAQCCGETVAQDCTPHYFRDRHGETWEVLEASPTSHLSRRQSTDSADSYGNTHASSRSTVCVEDCERLRAFVPPLDSVAH
uniref:Uncharacterized protein n=1 Tax=Neospora caninum (strain Liverpool) TaxID=572307 RepID=F0JBB2_NEOCL|nr:hypothetical protein, conserved [Neospora caninum Liverpool]CEL71379.1 TPA: hypothetical protein, conserved [Neospora caninum Liverpool]